MILILLRELFNRIGKKKENHLERLSWRIKIKREDLIRCEPVNLVTIHVPTSGYKDVDYGYIKKYQPKRLNNY